MKVDERVADLEQILYFIAKAYSDLREHGRIELVVPFVAAARGVVHQDIEDCDEVWLVLDNNLLLAYTASTADVMRAGLRYAMLTVLKRLLALSRFD